MRKIDYLVVHGTWTKPNMDIGAKEVREWHLQRGFSDIGYNLLIRRNGVREIGRDLDCDGDYMEEIGAHVRGYNKRSLGVALVGGMGYGGRDSFNYTKEQMAELYRVLNEWVAIFPNAKVVGHNELDSKKTCPCFDVHSWWYGGNIN